MAKIKVDSNFSLRYFFVCLLIFSVLACKAQEVKVRSGFFADSVGIGEKTKYYLTATYPSKLNVIFPDSTYAFKPFEFEGKQYFSTKTKNDISYDSVIYSLSTFEVDSIQTLKLPVFVVSKNDSVAFFSDESNIILAQLVPAVPDSIPVDKLPLKMNTAYQHVSFLFNYPVLVIVVGVLLIVALVAFVVFGKKIRKYFKIKRLKKNHQKFLEAYATQIDLVKSAFSPVVAEATLVIWKKYLEQLESRPFTKLTTREIVLLEKDENLGTNLKGVDKAIYGRPSDVVIPLENLGDYAENKFLKKLAEVNHG